ncbi:MAG: DNA topoisomerase III [Betaproteobacteria bacterium RIFCSPLOWO2_02_FULL_67_26]|nr:MAG: DNA topoisomerase III [Betaproteobacteria bacterium RIFCSPLOWO2_02_FULL_67_26]
MGKQLIIAEKPSVAADIARALGGFKRHNDYFESDDYVLSSAVGHLLELRAPEEHDPRKGRWTFKHLPVIPPHFELAPIERSEQRLNLLLRLMKRKDVSGLVNACDAGREGELIFRYIVQHAKVKKPIVRLWLQSMTQGAIREGFAGLRADRELLPLADAAKCRSEADWLIGINGTRAMTAFNNRISETGFFKTTVGRVQTPTLAILVEREERIKAFTPRDYWEVHARFGAKGGEYAGRWFDADFKKDDDAERKTERMWGAAAADAVVAACQGRTGTVEEETKPATQLSPLLFDLTSLQREANGRFGFSARTTLSLAQALYERHKVLTYPRTDARALPEDYLGTVKKAMEMLSGSKEYAPFAKSVLKNGWVKLNKRVFDNTKISDHFAIIPTLQAPKHLNEIEQKLYDLVVRRFLAVFHPPAEYLQTTRVTRVEEHSFKTEGRILQNPGWLAIYGKLAQEENLNLPAVAANEKVDVLEVTAAANQTKPPARFSEATLLSAMEGAGKLVEDDELREAMEAKGLGTPATRAAVIEGLLYEDYIHRNGRELVPTPKAFSLMFALKHFGVTEITSPELTGDWEYKLKQMEGGKLPREEFMDHIEQVTRDLVERIRRGEIPDEVYAIVEAPCPKCGGVVQENYRKFQCQKCEFSLYKVSAGREWSPEEVAELITKRFIGPLTGFRSRMGKPFSAGIRLNNELKIEFDFGQVRLEEEAANPPDFTNQESLGACPKCGARVFEYGTVYVCEKAVGAERSCEFRSGKMILQQPVERAQMQKLLATGRTDLLKAFVSKKGRRFKAFLVKTADGKVGFEFEARAPRTPKAGEPAPAPYTAPQRGRGAPAQPAPAAKRPKAAAKAAARPKRKAA